MRRSLWLLLIAIATLLYGIDLYRHRFVRHNTDLVRLLPTGEFSLAYADLELLRKAELLGLLANIKLATDQQYADFVEQTGFDYTRDLQAVAIGFEPAQTFLLGRGRFHWDRLQQFARSHRGSCESDQCQAPAATAGRWVNFLKVQPDVLAVAISSSSTAVDHLRPPGRRHQEQAVSGPIWVKLSHTLLADPSGLPLPLQIFGVSLQSAEWAVFSAQPNRLLLKAHFVNPATADTARAQLEMQTGRVKTALQQDEAGNLGGLANLLASGAFQVAGDDVLGQWPVSSELLRLLR